MLFIPVPVQICLCVCTKLEKKKMSIYLCGVIHDVFNEQKQKHIERASVLYTTILIIK